VDGTCPTCEVTLSPHLVMRGNLDYFLQHQSQDVVTDRGADNMIETPNRAGYMAQ
jgi:hypothetical protein